MKLLRYGPEGHEKTGLLDAEGRVRDLSDHLPDLAGEAVSTESLARIAGPVNMAAGRRHIALEEF